VVWSTIDSEIQLWELTLTDRFDGGLTQNRVQWQVETPAYTFGDPLQLKELESAELWIDKLLGTVDVLVEYRPDNWPCWIPWMEWEECTTKDCREDVELPCADDGYPHELNCESFRATRTLNKPPARCIPPSSRPSTQGYQFQLRITIRGWCRIRGIVVHGWTRDKRPFERMVNVAPASTLGSPFSG
jgi:hypothetical protein